MTDGALEGLRVLEYARMVSGPYCAKLLADLGAEVVKIEQPSLGDPARQKGPFPGDLPHPEKSGLFLYLNTNKLGITLDVQTEEGRKVFRELAQEADILIEDSPPGRMEELGLNYESLSALNPRLIVTSITPYGQTGPYRDRKSYHLNLYHASGHSAFVYIAPSETEGPPVVAGGLVGDYDAGLTAAVATLGALFWRLHTGEGQHVDISELEALVGLERVEVNHFANNPEPRRWPGMIGGLMPCKDGYVVITAAQDHQWWALVELMGNPAWAQEEECKNEFTRSQHRDEIQPRILEWMRQHTREEIYHQGQRLNVPVGPVRTVEEIAGWEQARQRGFFAELDHAEAGRLTYLTAAYRLSETPWRGERAAPLLGQHNEQVYCGRLAYSREELARLAAEGVV
ncbi:MAG: CoA transferase [Dehalococcoidia bacterium]